MRTLAIAVLLAWSGCAVHAGPFDAALFGSYYTHREINPGAEMIETSRWQTAIGRTWGTVDIEAAIDLQTERVASTGDGMSANMAGVIGEEVGEAIAHDVVCALQPLTPNCATLGSTIDSLMAPEPEP
jgi:hypothetical protein